MPEPMPEARAASAPGAASTWPSSRASRAPGRRPPARSSRTSATPSSTTCRARCVRDLAELVANDPERYDRVAIVLDVRQGDAPLALGAALGALHGRDIEPQIVFLEASDEALVRRYSETRHRHPLDTENDGVQSAIARERLMLADVRDMAQTTIDTSDLSFKQLRERIIAALGAQPGPEQLVAPGHQLRLQVRRAPRGGPRVRRALHGEPLLPTRAAGALGPHGARPRLRAQPAHHAAASSSSSTASSRRSSRPTSPRARPASPSPSAAPAASIARWPSARPWPPSWPRSTSGPVMVWHRELEKHR